MKPLKEKISITLDGDVLQRIRELAEEDGRPLSQYINLVLRNFLKNK
ncbi:MAG: toxin-antitoxin system protein [Eubacteriales bacterium]|nr:toxin-antitoxin system protein [Eubacteriales bacterium]